MPSTESIKSIQSILGVPADGAWGPLSQQAFNELIHGAPRPATPDFDHCVNASSFANPADIAAFRAAKARGESDQEAFREGDNGIGCWGDDTTGQACYCALPPEDMEEKWGSVEAAKHKPVLVIANGRTVQCRLGDRMPKRSEIHNGAGIDMNPALCAALGLTPPVMIPAVWRWA